MKTIHAILAITFAALFISVFSFASEDVEVERHIKIKIDQDGELIDLEADDMEVGETRQSFTDSGKEVLLTRTESGFDLTVDGKEIDIDIPHVDHHSVFMHGGGDAKVFIKKLSDEDDGNTFTFIHGDEGGEHHWVEKGEDDHHMIFIERTSAADHLLESGVLEDLDEETRRKILDTLKEIEPEAQIKKRIIVEVDEEVHEYN